MRCGFGKRLLVSVVLLASAAAKSYWFNFLCLHTHSLWLGLLVFPVWPMAYPYRLFCLSFLQQSLPAVPQEVPSYAFLPRHGTERGGKVVAVTCVFVDSCLFRFCSPGLVFGLSSTSLQSLLSDFDCFFFCFQGGVDFKKAIVEAIIKLLVENPEAKDTCKHYWKCFVFSVACLLAGIVALPLL